MHLALPVAVDLGMRGWWRGAGWSLAVAAFGAWGLADRWMSESATDNPARARWVRIVRVAAARAVVVPPIILLLDTFLSLLGNVAAF